MMIAAISIQIAAAQKRVKRPMARNAAAKDSGDTVSQASSSVTECRADAMPSRVPVA